MPICWGPVPVIVLWGTIGRKPIAPRLVGKEPALSVGDGRPSGAYHAEDRSVGGWTFIASKIGAKPSFAVEAEAGVELERTPQAPIQMHLGPLDGEHLERIPRHEMCDMAHEQDIVHSSAAPDRRKRRPLLLRLERRESGKANNVA